MNQSFDRLKLFCDANRLKINASKSHFLELVTPPCHGTGNGIEQVALGGSIVEARHQERVLGVITSDRLCGWRPHIQHVLSACSKKMSALKLGGKHYSFKQRLATGRAVHLSKLFYSIEVWGPGLSISQVQQLQACQNKLLAWVCHRRGENSTRQNLKECNVLTVNQTIAFRVLLTGLTTLRTGRPRGLNDMIRRGERGRGGMETRSEGNEVQRICRSYFVDRTWRNNFLLLYEKLPGKQRTLDMGQRKGRRRLESWVKANVGAFVT